MLGYLKDGNAAAHHSVDSRCSWHNSDAMHSGEMQCILVKSDDFENSYPHPLIYSSLNPD